MDDQDLLKKIVARNPLRIAGMQGSRVTRRALLAGASAGLAAAALGGPARAEDRVLNQLVWDGYADPRMADLWKKDTGGTLKPEIHISDPQSVNRLRAGETKNFDFLNVNDPWARKLSLAGEADRRGAA